MKIEKEEIYKLLPHRDPFLFVDWCEIIEIGKKEIEKNQLAITQRMDLEKKLLEG